MTGQFQKLADSAVKNLATLRENVKLFGEQMQQQQCIINTTTPMDTTALKPQLSEAGGLMFTPWNYSIMSSQNQPLGFFMEHQLRQWNVHGVSVVVNGGTCLLTRPCHISVSWSMIPFLTHTITLTQRPLPSTNNGLSYFIKFGEACTSSGQKCGDQFASDLLRLKVMILTIMLSLERHDTQFRGLIIHTKLADDIRLMVKASESARRQVFSYQSDSLGPLCFLEPNHTDFLTYALPEMITLEAK